MKKILILLSIGILIVSCESQEKVGKDDKIEPYSTEEIASHPLMHSIGVSEELFEALKKNKFYKSGQYKIDSLVLIPTDKSEIKFTGRPNSKIDYSEYNYLGSLITTGFHLVSHQSNEYPETFLINYSGNIIDTLWGNQPTINISGEVIITKSMGFGQEGMPNGFQVWQLSHTEGWKKIVEINQQLWIPIEIRVSNTMPAFFIVKRISADESQSKNPKYEYMKYSIN
jgi:hypothetical protein